jgi:hypothetical protein
MLDVIFIMKADVLQKCWMLEWCNQMFKVFKSAGSG